MTAEFEQEVYAASELTLKTKKRHINPRSETQGAFIDAMNKYEMVFGLGPAGTGKTFLAVAKAVSAMLEGKVDRIILTRPAVEAGENLGFLPGNLKEKIDPYLRPLYDALFDMLGYENFQKYQERGCIDLQVESHFFRRPLCLQYYFDLYWHKASVGVGVAYNSYTPYLWQLWLFPFPYRLRL